MSVTDVEVDRINAYFSGKDEENKVKLCTFWICNRLFGVNIKDVREINKVRGISKIFHAPQAVKGYVNIRGQIHLILDLISLLGLHQDKEKTLEEEMTLVVFKESVGEPFGIIIDKIGDVIEVGQSIIEYSSKGDSSFDQSVLIDGVCKLENELLMLLNAGSFLKQVETK